MQRGTKEPPDEGERGDRGGLKLKISKTDHGIPSHPIMDDRREKSGSSDRFSFLFLGSRITENVYCSHEIKRCLLFGRKAMTNLGNLLKNKDIHLPIRVHIVKAMAFPVVMYRCES